MALQMQIDRDGTQFVVVNGKRHNIETSNSAVIEGSAHAQQLVAELDQLQFGPRWAKDVRMRAAYGVAMNHGPDSAEWKDGFRRFVAGERRWAAQQKQK